MRRAATCGLAFVLSLGLGAPIAEAVPTDTFDSSKLLARRSVKRRHKRRVRTPRTRPVRKQLRVIPTRSGLPVQVPASGRQKRPFNTNSQV